MLELQADASKRCKLLRLYHCNNISHFTNEFPCPVRITYCIEIMRATFRLAMRQCHRCTRAPRSCMARRVTSNGIAVRKDSHGNTEAIPGADEFINFHFYEGWKRANHCRIASGLFGGSAPWLQKIGLHRVPFPALQYQRSFYRTATTLSLDFEKYHQVVTFHLRRWLQV